MAILAGRDGQVKWDPVGVTPVLVVSLNNWKLSLKTDKIDVTCFGDTNKVYVPGMRDVTGSVSGFYNSASLVLIDATDNAAPGLLELIPHLAEPTKKFSGLAYLDAEIDTSADGAPALTGEFMAAGPWTLPT